MQQLFIPKIIWIKNGFQTIFFRKHIKTVINHFSNIFYRFLLFCCPDIFCPPMWCVMLFVLMCIHLQTRLFRQVHVASQGPWLRGRQIIMIYINLPVNKNIKICKIIISKCFCLFNRHVDFLENSWTLKKWVKKPKKWSYKLRDDGNAVLSNQICIDRVICDHGWGKNQFNIIRKSRDDTVSFGSSKLKMLQ